MSSFAAPGGARPRDFRFPTGGDHRRLAVAVAGRPLDDDPLRGHLGSGRARPPRAPSAAAGTTCSSPAPRPGSVCTTSASASRATSCGSPPPRPSVTGHDEGGNWFAPARVAVPTAAGPLGPHFEVVAERLTQARRRAGAAIRRRRWRRRSATSPRRCSFRRCRRKPARSTSSPPRSRASAGRVASAVLASRPAIRSDRGSVAR